jgi:hypothetical protein
MAGAVFGVALPDRAESERRALGHELSHHIGGRDGGSGFRMPQVTILPPQLGQTEVAGGIRTGR